MADELIDVCDESNNLIGIQKMKSEAHRDGSLHRATHVWIYNSKGDILLQLRAKDKPFYPNLWDISAAGHVTAGEDPLTSGFREVKEEIGLEVKKEDLQFLKIRKIMATYNGMKNNEFNYVYLLKFDGDIKKLVLQDEEVQEIRFFPVVELEKELKTNASKFVLSTSEYWFEIIDEVRRKLGMR